MLSATFHLVEYGIEAWLLGTFMVVACGAVVLFQHPESRVRRAFPNPHVRRGLIGVIMGLTAIALIYSPLGQRSGAHINPAVTLTFFALGKVGALDAAMYVVSQFIGAIAGVQLSKLVLGPRVMHEAVRCAVTEPGRLGPLPAWAGEFVIAFILMTTVLHSTNHAETAAYTGLFAGVLVATYITVEAPLSGMSMNPARTIGSGLGAGRYRSLWVYMSAPPLAMLSAGVLYVVLMGPQQVYCCKLHHPEDVPCIFHCQIDRMPTAAR